MLDKVNSDPFDIAKQNLMEPYGLTEGNLFDLYSRLEVKGVDFGDAIVHTASASVLNLNLLVQKRACFRYKSCR